MNEKLKFSVGHVFAFVTMLIMGYITFMGSLYLHPGKFVSAGIAVVSNLIPIFILFIGVQWLKGTEIRFKNRIWLERLLFVAAPLLLYTMFKPGQPLSHFWTVERQSEVVTGQFATSIESSKKMFDEYDLYAQDRCERLDEILNDVVKNKKFGDRYSSYGFTGEDDDLQINNRIEALRAQLYPTNYDGLKSMSNEWIDKHRGATVWNVFLIGNVDSIKSSMTKWHGHLQKFSSKRFSIEDNVPCFDENHECLNNIMAGFDTLEHIFTTKSEKVEHRAVLFAVGCYLLLMLPYIIQRRSVKSRRRLFLPKKTHMRDVSIDKNHGIIWMDKNTLNNN